MQVVRVGAIGAGFMGATYSQALRLAAALAPGPVPRVELVRVADTQPEAAEALARAWGWGEAVADWRRVTGAADIDLVLVLTPNHCHREQAIDALAHGKHVVCEKPLADRLDGALAMARAAAAAGRLDRVGFVYRYWPAVQAAKALIADGVIGEVLHYRGRYFHDYGLDPEAPHSWRLDLEQAGGGAGLDIGSHVIDMARYLVGEIEGVFARSRAVTRDRAVVGRSGLRRPVTVDEVTDMLVELEGGATGVLQTSWLAGGHKMDLAFAVHGSRGTLEASFEQVNELKLYRTADAAVESGLKVIPLGPAHGGYGWLQRPVAGMGWSFADGFTVAMIELLGDLARGVGSGPSFLDGLRANEVAAAAQASAASVAWQKVVRASLAG